MKRITLLFLLFCATGVAKNPIVTGVSWFDQNNNEVNAHGACVVKEGNKYYLFGEHKSDTSNVFTGFGCYSSSDLTNWKFERVVMPPQKSGVLGPGRVGERVKVMKCPSTGEFVMYMHCDDMGYKDPKVGFATCKTINGNYEFKGALLYNGNPIRKWDMGTFQDTDGKGYVLIHGGYIYELADDYKSAKALVTNGIVHGESPTVFKHRGVYYWITSGLTHWERNDNIYCTAPSMSGPWTKRGLVAPEGKLTWNSQSTFVLPIYGAADTTFIYMGDRWSFPMQKSSAAYVWQPINISADGLLLPEFHRAWTIDSKSGRWADAELKFNKIDDKTLTTSGEWNKRKSTLLSNEKGATISCAFTGKQVAVYGDANRYGGYAKLTIKDAQGKQVLSTVMDFYCMYENPGVRFLSPELSQGDYTLSIEVMGVRPNSSDKSKTIFGSVDYYVTVSSIATK